MTVPSTPRIAGPFLGTGGGTTGPFPFTYPIFATSDVLVVESIAGVQNTLTLNSDYTVSMNVDQTNNPGGTVTLSAALFSPNTVTLGSQVPQTQATVLTNLGGFLPSVLNNALDKVTILIQQLATTVKASLSFPLADGNAFSGTLPVASSRANQFLAFDSAGNIITTPGSGTSVAISTPLVPVVQAVSVGAALTVLGGATSAALAAETAARIAASAALVPSGAMIMWPGVTAPTGWIEAKGQATAGMSASIITMYGANLPDTRGQFIRGWDDGAGVDTGRTILSTQTDVIKSFVAASTVTDPTHVHNVPGYQSTGGGNLGFNASAAAPVSENTAVAATGISVATSYTGGTETRPKNIAMMFIIKT